MAPDTHPVLGVFASDRGPGDAERASIMSQVGSFLARRGARLVCLGDEGVPVPLITSARTAGGEVTLIAAEDYSEPSAFGGVGIISSWVTLSAPCRIDVPMQSDPVSPPPITTTCLPPARIGWFVPIGSADTRRFC